MRFLDHRIDWKFVEYFKEYCANCTIAGLSYISNQRLHLAERLFWLVCLAISTFGSYSLINQFREEFQSKAVSIVYESEQPLDKIHFPTLSVCDSNNIKEPSEKVEAYIAPLYPEYQYSLENFLLLIVYTTEYIQNAIDGRCTQLRGCPDCLECPESGYRQINSIVSYNCSELFVECSFSDEPFDCCQYFLPFVTPSGTCYFMNSYLNNRIGSPNWMNRPFGRSDKKVAKITVLTRRPFLVNVLNPEDLPLKALPYISRIVKEPRSHKLLNIFLENTVNDQDVRKIKPEHRKCRFPDELLPDTMYKVYSFSTCLADCIRILQYRKCNCSLYTLIPNPSDRIPDCGLSGYYCLEALSMVEIDIQSYLPWNSNENVCDCLPSCSERFMRSYHESSLPKFRRADEPMARAVTIAVPLLPTERYRRQALRRVLDIVVTIGGIMGLFMGASVLSGLELIYYFTLRIYNTFCVIPRRRQQ